MSAPITIQFLPFPKYEEKSVHKYMPQGYSRLCQKHTQPLVVEPRTIADLISFGGQPLAVNDVNGNPVWVTMDPDSCYSYLGVRSFSEMAVPYCSKISQKVHSWTEQVPWELLGEMKVMWSNHGLVFVAPDFSGDTITTTEYGVVEALKAIVIHPKMAGKTIPGPQPKHVQVHGSREEPVPLNRDVTVVN